MTTPSRVAIAGSCAMAISAVVTNVIVQIAGPAISASAWESLLATLAGALGISVLAWVGMYFGARFSPSHQRNGRLAWLAAIAFGVLGVLLSLPIKTHAIMLDMPPAGDASAGQFMHLLLPVAFIAAVLLGSLLITRALAAVSSKAAR